MPEPNAEPAAAASAMEANEPRTVKRYPNGSNQKAEKGAGVGWKRSEKPSKDSGMENLFDVFKFCFDSDLVQLKGTGMEEIKRARHIDEEGARI